MQTIAPRTLPLTSERVLTIGDDHLNSVLRLYQKFAADSDFEKKFPRAAIYRILSDQEMSYYPKALNEILSEINSDPRELPLNEKFTTCDRASDEQIKCALGDMSLDEVRLLFTGPDPLHPSPESLLGRYISESGA
jgi:hypothetical protein